MVLVSLQEVTAIVATAVLLLLFTTKFGLIKRTGARFLEEFRKALSGSESPLDNEAVKHDVDDDEICYQLLGLTPSASQHEIRKAYLRKAKQYHPDKGGDPDMMRALTKAYRRLSRRG